MTRNVKTLEDLKLRSSVYDMCNITIYTVYYNTVEYYAVENRNHITVCMHSKGVYKFLLKCFQMRIWSITEYVQMN